MGRVPTDVLRHAIKRIPMFSTVRNCHLNLQLFTLSCSYLLVICYRCIMPIVNIFRFYIVHIINVILEKINNCRAM